MTVEHDEAGRRFVIHFADGDAQLAYERPDQGTIDLRHTRVPEGERGHGAAATLAQTAFDYARANHLGVIPTCAFVKTWLARHPAQNDIVHA